MAGMPETERQKSRPILAFLLTVIVAVWVGGSVIVDVTVIPSAFDHLARRDAAEVGATIFSKMNRQEGILGVAALLIAFGMGREAWGTQRRFVLATSLLLAMTAVAVAFLIFFTPALVEKWEAVLHSGVNVEDTSAMTEERTALRALHTVYGVLDVLKILAGTWVLFLIATRRPR